MDSGKKYRCLVVDDEPHAIEVLSDYIQATPSMQLVKAFQDPLAALLERDKEEQYDFIFLDIDMPGISGIELATALRRRTSFLVFTTAHPKYAIEAFDVAADHYLLKPISLAKFATVIERLLQGRDQELTTPAQATEDGAFFVKSEQKNKFIKIQAEEIMAVEGLKNYVILHTLSQRHVVYLTMKEMEEALAPTGNFIRVHKSYVVAKKYLSQVEGNTIRLTNNLEVPIGSTYRQVFFEYLSRKAFISGRSAHDIK